VVAQDTLAVLDSAVRSTDIVETQTSTVVLDVSLHLEFVQSNNK